MNRYTKDIMNILNVDVQTALDVQNRMECNGIDYSECSTRTFKKYAKEAFNELSQEQLA